MLSGESTPLLKESIELWEADAHVLTLAARTKCGTKILQLSPGEPACTPDGGCLAVAHWPCKQCLQREVFPSWALSVFKYVFYSYLILYIFSIIFLSAFTGMVCLRTTALEAPTVAPTHATREPTVAPVWCGELARRSAHAERQTNTTVALTGRRSKLPDI